MESLDGLLQVISLVGGSCFVIVVVEWDLDAERETVEDPWWIVLRLQICL